MDDNNAAGTPPTETQRALQEIWCEVLGTDRIGVYDDFLDIGGDSLAAMRCINRINARFGVEVPLDLFMLEPAHIAEVAAHLERIRQEAAGAALPDTA